MFVDHKHLWFVSLFSVMVNSDGLMEYVVELIDNMASKPAHHLRLNPLVIAHCIGAMKIVTAISVAQESHVSIAEIICR